MEPADGFCYKGFRSAPVRPISTTRSGDCAMFMKSVLAAAATFCAISLAVPAAHAETLHAKHSARSAAGDALPRRGLSMAQVQKRYGAPLAKLAPAGGDAPRHPVINRWRYDGYTVYFERNRVIHTVVDSAGS